MDDVWMLKKNILENWNCDRFLCDISEPEKYLPCLATQRL